MAKSGYKEVIISTNHHSLCFEWELVKTNPEERTSTIRWRLFLKTSSSGRMVLGEKDWSIKVNGIKYSGKNNPSHEYGSAREIQLAPFVKKDSTEKLWQTQVITHNTDGSKTFEYSFSQEFSISNYGSNHVSVGTITGSGKGVLDPIYDLSTVSATNCAIGDKTKITINKKNKNYTHKLAYKIGENTSYATIVSELDTLNYEWTIPGKVYLHTENKKANITIRCTTLLNGVALGNTTTTITVKEKDPSTISIPDTNDTAKEVKVTIKKQASYFCHKLFFLCNGEELNSEIKIDKSKNSYTWDFSKIDLGSRITNNTFGEITAKCKTFYGDYEKLIGETTTKFKIHLNEKAYRPQITDFAVIDTSGPASIVGVVGSTECLKGYNILVFKGMITGQQGAKIASYQIKNGNKTFTKTFTNNSNTNWSTVAIGTKDGTNNRDDTTNLLKPFNYSDNNTFLITATDTRGFTTTNTCQIEMIPYEFLTANFKINAIPEEVNNKPVVDIKIDVGGKGYKGIFTKTSPEEEPEKPPKENKIYYYYKIIPLNQTIENSESITVSEGTKTEPLEVSFNENDNTFKIDLNKKGLSYADGYRIEFNIFDELVKTGLATYKQVQINYVQTIPVVPTFYWNQDQFIFNVPVKTKKEGYYDFGEKDSSKASLNLNNGDICGCNAIIFNDNANNNEGIMFSRPSTESPYWDLLRVQKGHLQIIPNFGENSGSDSDAPPGDTPVYNLCYYAGDIITYPSGVYPSFSGFFSSNGQTLYLTIPISKPCVKCTSAKLKGELRLRFIDGSSYKDIKVTNGDLHESINTISINYQDGLGLNVAIQFKSTEYYSKYQNTPISCSFDTGSSQVFQIELT